MIQPKLGRQPIVRLLCLVGHWLIKGVVTKHNPGVYMVCASSTSGVSKNFIFVEVMLKLLICMGIFLYSGGSGVTPIVFCFYTSLYFGDYVRQWRN